MRFWFDPEVTCNMLSVGVNERVGEYRRRMRERGYRPVQIWVPDVHSPGFAAEAQRQSALLAEYDRSHPEDQSWVDASSVDWDAL